MLRALEVIALVALVCCVFPGVVIWFGVAAFCAAVLAGHVLIWVMIFTILFLGIRAWIRWVTAKA